MTDRPTVRPVTLARIIETVHACKKASHTTSELATTLDVSHRRARETILETLRIGLIAENVSNADEGEPWYMTTQTGMRFLHAVKTENWDAVSSILEEHSPHYNALLNALSTVAPASLEPILGELEEQEAGTGRSYNQTSIEVLSDWGERLGRIQRNAFTGTYYPVVEANVPQNFDELLLEVFDDLEETAGVSLRQRYLSIPKLREHCCERVGCPRKPFDVALIDLAQQNVGKVELSGAPFDTAAKDARFGIKSMALAQTGWLVSTDQSTEQVMRGVEQFGKRYYYLAVHDCDLNYTPQDND